MFLSYLLLFICLTFLLAGLIFSDFLIRIDTTTYGFLFGAIYFLTFPLLVLLLTGNLGLPIWFNSTGLEDIIVKDHLDELLILCLYIIGIYVVFFLKGIRNGKRFENLDPNINNNDSSAEFRVYFGGIFLYFVLSLYLLISTGVLSGGHWYNTRSLYIQESGVVGLIQFYSIWGLRLIIVSHTFELLDRKKISYFTALIVIVAVCLYEIFYVGNRIVILMFGITGFFHLYRKHGIIKLLPFVFSLIPIALVMAAYQNVRYLLFNASVSEIISLLFLQLRNSNLLTTFLTAFEYGDTVVLLNLIRDVGQTVEPLYGSTFLRLVTWILPRSIWAEKPLPITLQIGNIYMPGVAPTALAFGEFHYNFADAGILIFPILLYFLISIERFFSKRIKYHFYFDFTIGFLLFRLPISDMFIATIFTFLIYKVLSVRIRFMTAKVKNVNA